MGQDIDQPDQHIYEQDGVYYLVDIWPNGAVQLKIKEGGLQGTWTAALQELTTEQYYAGLK